MNVLFLGPENSPLLQWLVDQGEEVIQTADVITPAFVDQCQVDFLVSYGYWPILKKGVLDRFPARAVNLHISYLPWNRGIDPNLWSFIEGTPKGITIHYLDEGVDTGDIIVQQRVTFELVGETLATTYQKLQLEIQELFKRNWSQIRVGTCPRAKQLGCGSFHRVKDRKSVIYLLMDGWDTPVEKLRNEVDDETVY